MWVQSIEFLNFRNYEKMKMELDPGINLLYGDNGQGKTNVLEGIYLCSTTGSHRRSVDKEMIFFGRREYHIRMHAFKGKEMHRIDIHYTKEGRKGIAIDGLPLKKATEMFGYLNVVMFAPEDLMVVKEGPSERRRFLDREICQTDPVYMEDLSGYNRVLMQRNKLLKTLPDNMGLIETLDIWDEQLVRYGKRIIKRRREYLRETEEISKRIHRSITDGKEEIGIQYEENAVEEKMAELLKKNRQRDVYNMTTGTGPHRDDFSIKINGIDTRRFGSQGQQRSAAVSLKLSEIEIIRKKTGEMPVLLLDDVFSELDHSRQESLLKEIKSTQTIITGTGIDAGIRQNLTINKRFYVKEGTVTEVSGNGDPI